MAQSLESKADQAKQQAQGVMDKARDAAGNVADQASQMAQGAMSAAKDAAGNLREKAGQGAAAVAGGMQNLAGTLREHAGDQGMVGQASGYAAEALDRGAHFLQDSSLDGMADDLGAMIRKNPIPAVLIGVGVGFVLGRLLRS